MSPQLAIPKTPEERRALLDALKSEMGQLNDLVNVLEAAPIETPSKPATLREKIEQALSEASLDVARLAKAVGVNRDKVQACVDELRKEGVLYNVGFEDLPIWTLKVGDAEMPKLIAVVKRLISERPMYLRDVVRATGAKESRVSGALVEVQRMYKVIDNSVGEGHAKQYFLIGEHIKNATLPPKVTKGGPITHGNRRAKAEAKAAALTPKR